MAGVAFTGLPLMAQMTCRPVFHTSALTSIRCCHEPRRFYDRKRAEGKRHIPAVLTLARRSVDVLWALLRDGRRYQAIPPVTDAARQLHWEVFSVRGHGLVGTGVAEATGEVAGPSPAGRPVVDRHRL